MCARHTLLRTTTLLAALAMGLGSAAAGPTSAPFPAALEPLSSETEPFEMAPNLRRQVVAYSPNVAAGTIIVDTANTYLYLVLGDGRAIRYGIGVGREGFTWSGAEQVTQGGVARLDPAGRYDRASAVSRSIHGRGRRQPAWRTRHLSRQDNVPNSRHQRAADHRHERLEWLHPT